MLCMWPGVTRRPTVSCLIQELVCPTTPHTASDGCLKRQCLWELLLDSHKDLEKWQEHSEVWGFLTLPTTGPRRVSESPNVEDWSPWNASPQTDTQAGDEQYFLQEKSEITDFQPRRGCRLCAPHTERGRENCSINNFSTAFFRRSAKVLEKLLPSFQLNKTSIFQ